MRKQNVALLFDKSGSMKGKEKFAVDAMNEQVQTIKARAKDMDIAVTLVHFNQDLDFLLFQKPASELQEVPLESYEPNGGTSLRDCVGVTIDRLMDATKDDGNPGDFLIVTITDGDDTSSSMFDQTHIAEKIQMMKEKGWTFTYLGMDGDLDKVAKDFNIDRNNIASFAGPRGCEGAVGPEGAMGATGVRLAAVRTSRGLNAYFDNRANVSSTAQANASKSCEVTSQAFTGFYDEEEAKKLYESKDNGGK